MNLVYLLLIWYGFQGVITSGNYIEFPYHIVSIARKIDEVFILLLLFNIVINFERFKKRIPHSVWYFIFSFSAILYFSSVINFISPIIFFEFLFRYGKGIIIFIYCLMFFKFSSSKVSDIMNYMRYFFILQFLINFSWVLGLKLLPNVDFYNQDFAIGTFGNAALTSIYSGFILSASIFEVFIRKGLSKKRIFHIFFIMLCIIQLIWADTKHLNLLIPVILLFQLLITGLIKIRYIVIPSFLILFFSMLYFDKEDFKDTSIGRQFNMATAIDKSIIKHTLTLISQSPKIIAYYHSFVTIPGIVPFRFLGAGPGNGGSFIATENKSEINFEYFTKYNIEELRVGNTIITLPYTGINTIQSELGYFGLALILVMFFYLFRTLLKIIKFKLRFDKYNIICQVNFTALFCLLLFFLENLLADFLQHTFIPIVVWFIIGIFFVYNRDRSLLNSIRL